MLIFAYKKIPSLKIKFSLFTKDMLKDVISFSLFAYIVTFSNMIIFKTDQMVIAMFGTVAFAALYQISSRLADMFRQFSTQFYDNLNPIASVLFTKGDKDNLSDMLIYSTRLVGFISTMLLVPIVIYTKPLLLIWLNIDDEIVTITAIILLFALYSQVFLRDTVEHILLMIERHKELTIISSLEAIANLVLSIIFIKYYGIVGVAFGTLIPNIILALIYNIPVASKFTNNSISNFFKIAIKGNILSGLITAIIAYSLFYLFQPTTLIAIVINGISVLIIYLIVYYFFGLTSNERQKLAIPKLF